MHNIRDYFGFIQQLDEAVQENMAGTDSRYGENRPFFPIFSVEMPEKTKIWLSAIGNFPKYQKM
jgi:hypothetical protein